jgi:hypothetical protein
MAVNISRFLRAARPPIPCSLRSSPDRSAAGQRIPDPDTGKSSGFDLAGKIGDAIHQPAIGVRPGADPDHCAYGCEPPSMKTRALADAAFCAGLRKAGVPDSSKNLPEIDACQGRSG